MGAPVGNKNALGNRGGGRPTAYVEKSNAAFLKVLFDSEVDIQQLIRKIKYKQKYSIMDRVVLNALAGNEKALIALFNKRFPDKPRFSRRLSGE